MAELIPSYNFRVKISNTELGFLKISGLSREIQVESVAEGGLNTMVHIFPKPMKEAGKLRLEAGVLMGIKSPLIQVGTAFESMQVEVLNQARKIAFTYQIRNVMITRYEVSELNAMNNSLLIETFELSYGEMYVEV